MKEATWIMSCRDKEQTFVVILSESLCVCVVCFNHNDITMVARTVSGTTNIEMSLSIFAVDTRDLVLRLWPNHFMFVNFITIFFLLHFEHASVRAFI